MIPEKLKQIDESLIKLLRDRLSILAESQHLTLEAQLADVSPLLTSVGLPESVWTNVLISCLTALPNVAASINSAQLPSAASQLQDEEQTTLRQNSPAKPRKVTIIGGRGRMGRFFTHHLCADGHKVSILGHHDWEAAEQLLGQADLVLVSVPIDQTVDIIKRAAKYLTPTTALADITSLKVEPVQAMLDSHTGPVMGLHPMFGPSVQSFSGQKVVVCPGRDDESFQWLLDLIASKGGELITSTPEEHDWMMVVIQATRHFSRFSLGVFLAAEKIDIDRSLLMSSPTYRLEIDILNRLFAQSPYLCADIILATEERCQAIARLANTYNRLAQLVAKKDRATLIREFEAVQRFLSPEPSQPQPQEPSRIKAFIKGESIKKLTNYAH